MLRRHLLVLALLLLLPPSFLQSQTRADPEIVVTATGSASFIPDRATVVIEVRTEAATPREASSKNAPVMSSVISALGRMGYSGARITTRGYTVQPTYRYDNTGPTVTGYAATNAVTLRIETIQRVGETLDTALAAGATRVVSARFESSKYDEIRREAMQRAVALARQDAEAIARAAGGVLGDLLSITTDPRPVRDDFMLTAAAAPAYRGETPISAGEQTLTVSVQGRWKFERR